MKEIIDTDFTDLLEEDYIREWDECDEMEVSFEEEHKWDGLDPGFSSWQDYYNYKFG